MPDAEPPKTHRGCGPELADLIGMALQPGGDRRADAARLQDLRTVGSHVRDPTHAH